MQWRQAGGKMVFGGAMLLAHPIPGAFDGPLDQVILHGPNIEQARQRTADYFKWIRQPPQWIVLDEEQQGISYWQLTFHMPEGAQRVAVFKPVWENKAAFAKLPQELQQFTPEDLATYMGRGRAAILAWEAFAGALKRNALRQVVYDPAVAAFGDSVAVSQYDDMAVDFPVYDMNGWPITSRQICGNWSSPSCYLWNQGQRYRNQPKAVTWNNFIDSLNYVRSCMNRSARVAPWVSYPSFHEDKGPLDLPQQRWLWRELIEHLKATGVTTFLYFNPKGYLPDGDESLAANAFAAATGAIAPPPFEPIPLNADEVRTGTKTTRYAEWEKAAWA